MRILIFQSALDQNMFQELAHSFESRPRSRNPRKKLLLAALLPDPTEVVLDLVFGLKDLIVLSLSWTVVGRRF